MTGPTSTCWCPGCCRTRTSIARSRRSTTCLTSGWSSSARALAAQLRSKAKANSLLLEGIPDAQLRWLYANATALVAPSHEDFGLTVVEAAAFGTPALALRAGGYLDTVEPGLSGYFFSHPKAADIADAVHRHRERPLDRDAVAEHARGFDEDAFIGRIRNEVDLLMAGAFADRKHPHPA